MLAFSKRRSKQAGLPPGSLVAVNKKTIEPVQITLIGMLFYFRRKRWL